MLRKIGCMCFPTVRLFRIREMAVYELWVWGSSDAFLRAVPHIAAMLEWMDEDRRAYAAAVPIVVDAE